MKKKNRSRNDETHQNQMGLSSSRFKAILSTIILAASLTKAQGQYLFNSTGSTIFDGQSFERAPSYFSMNGTNGLSAQLDSTRFSNTRQLDYFIRMCIRPAPVVILSPQTKANVQTFLEIPQVLRCSINITRQSLGCTFLQSSGAPTISQDISLGFAPSTFFPFNNWIHLSLSGSQTQNQTYMRLDFQDQQFKQLVSTGYMPIQQSNLTWTANLGYTANLTASGFIGDIREFLFSNAFLNASQVNNVKNQVQYWTQNHIANYRLQRGELIDGSDLYGRQASFIGAITVPWNFDYIPIDMCQAPLRYQELLRINTDQISFSTPQLDARLQPTSNFVYTASFWMKTLPGIKTTPNPQIARDGLTFFDLQEVFGLWFFDPTTIRAFFHATRSVFEYGGRVGIYFPLGQWANLQIQIDRLSGYEMRVFDMQRRQQGRVSENLYLQDQMPTRFFTLVRNFKGYIKQIMLYNSKISLPIGQSNGNLEMIRDNSLLIYYKFDSQYFQQNASSYPNLATSTNNLIGPSVILTGNMTFDQVEWDDSFTFAAPSQIGSLQQTTTLYDGLACNRQKVLLYRTNSTNSMLQSPFSLNQNLTTSTVEFWFKIPSIPSNQITPTYLFSLYSLQTQRDQWSVYFNATQYTQADQTVTLLQALQCTFDNNSTIRYPFGVSSVRWEHVFCKYEMGYQMAGAVYSVDAGIRYASGFNGNLASLNVPQGQYQIVIGNRVSGGAGIAGLRVREFRIWKTSRTDAHIDFYRFSQIDQSTDGNLLSYFKLSSGDLKIVDFVSLFDNLTDVTLAQTTEMILDQDSGSLLTVCPQQSFRSDDPRCFRNPFMNHTLLVLPLSSYYNKTAKKVSFVFEVTSALSEIQQSSSRFSLFNNSNRDEFRWNVLNGTNSSRSLNSRYSSNFSSLFINSSESVNIESFTIAQQMNNRLRTFFSTAQTQFKPHPCQVMAPVTNMSLENELTSNIPLGINEIYIQVDFSTAASVKNFTAPTLSYKLHDYCSFHDDPLFNLSSVNLSSLVPPGTQPPSSGVSTTTDVEQYVKEMLGNEYATLFPSSSVANTTSSGQFIKTSKYDLDTTRIQWRALPPYQDIQINNVFDNRTQSYSIKIANEDWAKIKSYDTLYLVGSFQWNDLLNPFGPKYVQQNLVYKVKLVETFFPSITPNTTQVLIGEDLLLDGSQSYLRPLTSLSVQNYTPSDQQRQGLSYYWTCPEILKSICEKSNNRKFLVISYNDWEKMSQSGFGNSYSFSLQVFSAIDREVNLQLIPKVSVTVQWLKVFRPGFRLLIPTATQSGKILVSNENKFQIDYNNYAFNDPMLTVDWQIGPNITSSMISISGSGDILTLSQNSLAYSKKYQVSVTVSRKDVSFANRTLVFEFSIGGPPPKDGLVSMIPLTGTFGKTTFTFGLTSWVVPKLPGVFQQTPSVVKYTVKGKMQNSNQLITLTDRDFIQKEFFSKRIPLVQSLMFYIFTDQSDEFTTYEMPVTAQVDDILFSFSESFFPGSTAAQITESLEQIELKMLSLNAKEFQANLTQSSLQMRANVMQYLVNMTNQSSLIWTDQRFSIKIANILSLATLPQTQLTPQIAKSAQDLLSQILSSKPQTTTMANLAQAAGNLIIYNSFALNDTSNYTSMRILQQIVDQSEFQSVKLRIQQLIALVKQIADLKCAQDLNSVGFMTQTRLDTQAFEMLIENIPSNNLVYNRSYINTLDSKNSVVLPLREMLSMKNGSAFCNQVIFYKNNPFVNWKFFNQSIVTDSKPMIVQVSSLSTTAVGNNYTLPLQLSLQYSFNMKRSQYRNNQTTIMFLPYNLLKFNQSVKWQDDQYTSAQKFDHPISMISATSAITGDDQIYLYGLVTDYSRKYVRDKFDFSLENILNALQNFDFEILSIMGFILAFNLLMPIIATCLDKSSFNGIKKQKDTADVSEEMLRKIAINQSLHYDQVVYNRYQYAKYLEIKEQSFGKIFCLYFKNIHPLINIFYRFDVELKRLVRHILLSIQISIVAIITAIVLSQVDVNSTQGMTMADLYSALIVGFILSLLMLPMPNCMTSCLRIKMVVERTAASEEYEQIASAKAAGDGAQSQEIGVGRKNILVDLSMAESDSSKNNKDLTNELKQHEDLYEGGDSVDINDIEIKKKKFASSDSSNGAAAKYKFNSSGELSSKQPPKILEFDQTVTFVDRCVLCKILLVFFGFIFSLLAIGIVGYFSLQASQAGCQTIAVSFFISIVNGLGPLNLLRVLINAMYAPAIAMEVQDDEDGSGNGQSCCQKMWLANDAVLIMRDLLMVQQIQDSSFVGVQSDEKASKRNRHKKDESHQDNEKIPVPPQSQLKKDKIALNQTDRTHDDVSMIGDYTQDFNLQTDNQVTNTKRDQLESGKLSQVSLVDRRHKYQTQNQNSIEVVPQQVDRQSNHSKDDSQTNHTYGSKRRGGNRRQRGDSAFNTQANPANNKADLKRQGRRRLRQQRFQDDSEDEQASQEKKKGYVSPSEKQYTLSSPNEKNSNGRNLNNPFAPINKGKKNIGQDLGYKPNMQDSPDLSFASSVNNDDDQNKKSSRKRDKSKSPSPAKMRNEQIRGQF